MEKEIWNELGDEGFKELTHRFYQKVKEDPIMAPMYPNDDWEGSERRLYLFFTHRFGADETYLNERGHPRLRGRHMPFKIDEQAKEAWMKNMALSLEEMDIKKETKLSLYTFFSQVANFLKNH